MSRLLSTMILFVVAVQFNPWAWGQQADRVRQDGIPAGTLRSGVFSESAIFPGTVRDYSVYVPAQYDASQPARLMVFMDGKGYLRETGAFRVPVVLDNLIAQQDIPITIAVFVNPGTIPATIPGAAGRSNRSFEYDSLGDRYARFLVDEFLPVALEGLNVSKDPLDRAVCGISSGGICAFTVAWERPDQFSKVLSHIGSYTNIRGGWAYPGLVRKTKDKPKSLKIYLQEGRDDLSNLHGSWPLGNRDLTAALQYAGYTYKFEMTDGGHTGRYAGEVLPDAIRWLWDDEAEGTNLPVVTSKPEWTPHPDAVERSGVPRGVVHQMPPWESDIFAGTTRDWSVYVPAQYDAQEPAALMVFQDGERMRQLKGRWRIPTVFDNLIARGDMPVTIAVFLNPGHHADRPRRNGKHSNRGFEYDSLGDRYSRFLHEEILPAVAQRWNITDDPNRRAIGGSSSGAICAFTVAWERPDSFRNVYSSVGSFTNLRGGNVYPAWIRKTEALPIRVYMADTSGDVDNAFGSWWWANQRMASALQYMGYDVRFDQTEGYGHNADFGGRRFPEAMQWLWRHGEATPRIDTSDDLGGDLTLLELLVPGESWQVVTNELQFADALCCDKAGHLYYCDMKEPAVYRRNATTGETEAVARVSVSGLEFNPDGTLLYACQGSQSRLIAIDPTNGSTRVIADGVRPNDLAVSPDGMILFTDTRAGEVKWVDPGTGRVETAATGINRPNGICLSPDGGTLAVSEYGGTRVWLFRVNPGGKLDAGMPNMPLRAAIDSGGEFRFNEPPPYKTMARGDGSAVDSSGRYYVTSELGVQVFDPTGRPCGLLRKPNTEANVTTCIVGGSDHSTLYIAQQGTIYSRRLTPSRHAEKN